MEVDMSDGNEISGLDLAEEILRELDKRRSKPVQMVSVEYLKKLSEINRAFIQNEKSEADRHRRKAEKLLLREQRKNAESAKWVERICWRCKAKFKVHISWEKPPTMCKPCTKEIDETYLPSRRDTSTPFKKISLVPGGAPGSGRRK